MDRIIKHLTFPRLLIAGAVTLIILFVSLETYTQKPEPSPPPPKVDQARIEPKAVQPIVIKPEPAPEPPKAEPVKVNTAACKQRLVAVPKSGSTEDDYVKAVRLANYKTAEGQRCYEAKIKELAK